MTQNQLPDAPSGVMAVLQQQLSELTMDSNTEDNLYNVSSSGFYEPNEFQSALSHSRSSPSLCFYSHRGRSVEDTYMQDWEGHRARPMRSFLTRSFSAPYPPLEGIAEGIEDADEDDNETLWPKGQTPNGEDVNMNRPDVASIQGSYSNENGGSVGILCDHQGPTVEVDEGPTEEDIQQAMRVETYILALLQRYCLNQTSISTEVLGSASEQNCWLEPREYTSTFCEHPENSEGQEWKLYSDKTASQERYYLVNVPDLFSQAFKETGSTTIEVPTGIADKDTHHPYHPTVSPSLTFESPKQDWRPSSLEPGHRLPLGRLYQEKRWSSFGHMHVKSTNQSQPEGSVQSQGFTAEPEYGYHTLGQDTNMHGFNDDYMSSQRPWSSAVDLSQEEKVSLLREEELRGTHLLFDSYSPLSCLKYTEQDHYVGNDPDTRETQEEVSDSSLSETCSPGSSLRSSDSDDSGGLVWPQQVPPYVPSVSQNAPTAVVRIKASHALKRKILRFRTGSLKVMTTV